MLKRLMLAEPGSKQDSTYPPPPNQPLPELPEIRIQVETSSNIDESVTPEICITCGPLQACAELPVRKADLLRSTKNGCSICSLFWEVCEQTAGIDSVDYLSTWTGRGGVFNLSLSKDGSGNTDHDGEALEGSPHVLFLASNAGIFLPSFGRKCLDMLTEIRKN